MYSLYKQLEKQAFGPPWLVPALGTTVVSLGGMLGLDYLFPGNETKQNKALEELQKQTAQLKHDNAQLKTIGMTGLGGMAGYSLNDKINESFGTQLKPWQTAAGGALAGYLGSSFI